MAEFLAQSSTAGPRAQRAAISGRTPSLDELLRPGAQLIINDLPSLKGWGITVGENDLVFCSPQGERRLLPLDKIAAACPSLRIEDIYKQLKVKGANHTVYDVLMANKPYLEDEAKTVRTELNANGYNTLPQLFSRFEEKTQRRIDGETKLFAYRVCRLDEDVSDGLHPLDATLPTDQIEYIKALNNHVRNGTRKKAKAFISATWDIRSALAWSYYGIYKIVKVDIKKLLAISRARSGLPAARVIDVGGDDKDLLASGITHNFAVASKEVIFDGVIPVEACSLLEVRWENVHKLPAFSSEQVTTKANRKNKFFKNGFPKKLVLDSIDVKEVLETGSTKPLKVQFSSDELGQASQSTQSEGGIESPATPSLHTRAENMGYFVLKRGGVYADINMGHMVSEFATLGIYNRLDVPTPDAALYTLKVTVESERVHLSTKLLLTEWLDGKPVQDFLTTFNPENAKGRKRLEEFQRNLVVDFALCNFDVAGVDFSNLLLVENKIYRIDVGGSGFFDPTGQRKANDWFRSTISSITKTLDTIVSENSAKSGVSKTAAKKASANQARYQLIQSILGGGNQTFIKNLKYHAARVLTTYDAENALQIWVANTKESSDTLVDTVNTALRRLRLIETHWPDIAVPLEVPTLATLLPRHAVVSSPVKRKAAGPSNQGQEKKQKTGAGADDGGRVDVAEDFRNGVGQRAHGLEERDHPSEITSGEGGQAASATYEIQVMTMKQYTANKDKPAFKEKYTPEEWEIVDVTSKSKDQGWKKLSPFYPHGGIPVPGMQGNFSKTVEGIWQGLKIFEGKDVPGKEKKEIGVDLGKFKIDNLKGLKRTARSFGNCIGHVFEGRKLSYCDNNPENNARYKIYIPTYKYVLNNKDTAKAQIKRLKRLAKKKNILLLDYYSNGDIYTNKVLSHAALIKQYIENGL